MIKNMKMQPRYKKMNNKLRNKAIVSFFSLFVSKYLMLCLCRRVVILLIYVGEVLAAALPSEEKHKTSRKIIGVIFWFFSAKHMRRSCGVRMRKHIAPCRSMYSTKRASRTDEKRSNHLRTLRIREGRERSLLKRHPWVFESAIFPERNMPVWYCVVDFIYLAKLIHLCFAASWGDGSSWNLQRRVSCSWRIQSKVCHSCACVEFRWDRERHQFFGVFSTTNKV